MFAELYRAGRIGLELVPQGTLAERIRAAGAGIPAFYTPTAAGTILAQGKPHRRFDGRECLLEHALSADVALIKAAAADRHGNLIYNQTARNFAPLMATWQLQTTIAQTSVVAGLGSLDPETVVTPGIFADRVVQTDRAPQRFGSVHERSRLDMTTPRPRKGSSRMGDSPAESRATSPTARM